MPDPRVQHLSVRRSLLVGAVLLLGAAGVWSVGQKAGRSVSDSGSERAAPPGPAAAALPAVPNIVRSETPSRAPAPPRPTPARVRNRAPDSLPEDPFESQNGEDAAIRTLLAVGDIQLGVTRGSRIRDEPRLVRALGRIGDELERRSSGAQRAGAAGLQQILDGYGKELGQYMDGEIELRGPGWMIGVEVGTPPALGESWKPRPL